MKNLKDEIEEIHSQVAELEGVYLHETGKVTGAGGEGWYVKRDEVVALVTALIEQEKEKVKGLKLKKEAYWSKQDVDRSDSAYTQYCEELGYNRAVLEINNAIKQYLAERKE